MSIPITRYVSITSGVGGGVGVRRRDFIGLLFSESPFVSPDSILTFRNAADVGLLFGTDSEEYARAVQYFGFVNPAISSPQALSFHPYVPEGNDAAVIGNNDFKALATFTAIASGSLSFTLGQTPYNITGIVLTAATSLTDAASIIQTAIRAAGGDLALATVEFGIPERPSAFVVTIPVPGATVTPIHIQPSPLATAMGVTTATGAVDVASSGPVNGVGALIRAEQISNNFGSFAFMPTLTLTDVAELAAYNATQNLLYQYHQRVEIEDAELWSDALIGYQGLGLTLSPIPGEFPEMVPMSILASVRYNQRNSVIGYMYRQVSGLTPVVSTSTDADKYDGLRINYYGDTSTAGQRIAFYQRGLLMGLGTAPTDMGVYGNEQWLKDAATAVLLSLQLSLPILPANEQGRAAVLSVLQSVIDEALRNGSISIGKPLTAVQKVYIANQTGDPLAWQTVQSQGYVVEAAVESYTTTSGAVEYKITYSLIYAKTDQVRLIEGFHKLI